MHWRMFSSVPGLSMSVTTPASRHCQKSQTFDKRPPAIKIAHVQSHLLNEVILEDERFSKRTMNMCSNCYLSWDVRNIPQHTIIFLGNYRQAVHFIFLRLLFSNSWLRIINTFENHFCPQVRITSGKKK